MSKKRNQKSKSSLRAEQNAAAGSVAHESQVESSESSDATQLAARNFVLQAGIFAGFLPITLFVALVVRGAFTQEFSGLYFVPLLAVPVFVLQMLGLFLNSKRKMPVSKAAGRIIIVTFMFVMFTVVIMYKWWGGAVK